MRLILSAAGLAAALGLAALAMAEPAFAQSAPIETYCAQISDNDKYASDGFHLTDAGSILRQIVRAYPYVCVDIYRNFLNVYVGG